MSDDDTRVHERLARELPEWTLDDGCLQRRFTTHGWRTGMLVANGISHLAEVTWHHPDLLVSWGSVTVRLRTHSEDAITDKDFELATLIEQTVAWQPGPESALEGAPAEGEWQYLAGS
jgi:4a-hydroxytetrahydrobiopterin dehydratase